VGGRRREKGREGEVEGREQDEDRDEDEVGRWSREKKERAKQRDKTQKT